MEAIKKNFQYYTVKNDNKIMKIFQNQEKE